jgi:predicted  nucleic acid-binding Zn-ribbon protein
VDGAKERVASLFQAPEQFKAELDRSNINTIYKRARIRIHYYDGRGGRVEADQQALETIVGALKRKAKDAKEFNKYLSDLTWQFLNKATTERDFRFLEHIVNTNKSEEVAAAYDHVLDVLHAELAKFSARTNEADQHILSIRDNYRKGLTLAEVAKLRRDFSRMAI